MTRYDVDIMTGETVYTLHQVCVSAGVDTTFVCELVEEGVVEPLGDRVNEWRFDGLSVMTIHKAYRMHRDLHINMPGIALVLQLLDRLQRN